MAAQIELLVTENPRGTVANLFTQGAYQFGDFFSNEAPTFSVSLATLIQNSTGSRIWHPQSLAGYTVKVGIGDAAGLPLAGTFTLTYGANTTTALAFDATAATVSTALNLLASVIAAGGLTVATEAASFFIVTFTTVGVRTQITGDTTNIAPLSIIKGGTLIDGTAALQEVQSLQMQTQPAAFTTLSVAMPSAGCTVTTLATGGVGVNHKIQITLSPVPYDGSFTITVPRTTPEETGFIAFNASAADVVTAITALTNVGANNASAVQQGDGSWIVIFIGARAATDMGVITGSGAALSVLSGLSGTLDLRVAAVDLFLGGEDVIDAKLEVELTPPAGAPFKPIQQSVKLNRALISPSSASPALIAIPTSQVSVTITDLQGGSAAYLDNVVTAAMAVGYVMQFVRTGVGFVTYQLQASTAATASPGIIRPLDYAGGSNEKVWFSQ